MAVTVRLFDRRLMQMLTFLTRRRGWLSPKEVARDFRPDGQRVDIRTVHRWFSFLREDGGFVYYPYPRANAMGLQDVLVRIHGLRNPAVLGIVPYAASFNVDVSLADGHPFVSQGYWVPGPSLRAFEEFWEAARDVGLLSRVDVFRARNTHFVYSPFHEVLDEDGAARVDRPPDNSYFRALLLHHLRQKYEVRMTERVAASPLVIPLVVEHIWGHYSSRHVWAAIKEKGEAQVRKYGRALGHALDRPGAALQLLQTQWQALLDHFDEVFLQPRVFFDWPSVRNATYLSLMMRVNSVDRMVDAAIAASQHAIVTAVKPGLGPEGWFHISSFLPMARIRDFLGVADAFHAGPEPPRTAIQDWQSTIDQFRPDYCRVDWRLFDPASL